MIAEQSRSFWQSCKKNFEKNELRDKKNTWGMDLMEKIYRL